MSDIDIIFDAMAKEGHRFYLMQAQGVLQTATGQTILSQSTIAAWNSKDGAIGRWLGTLQEENPQHKFSIKADDITDGLRAELSSMLEEVPVPGAKVLTAEERTMTPEQQRLCISLRERARSAEAELRDYKLAVEGGLPPLPVKPTMAMWQAGEHAIFEKMQAEKAYRLEHPHEEPHNMTGYALLAYDAMLKAWVRSFQVRGDADG